MNYKNHCRTCLGNSKEMRHYQTIITIAGVDVQLIDILNKFYNHKIATNKSFPENICINCVHQLTVTYSFKILIEKSSKILQECVSLTDSMGDNYDSDFGSDDHKTSSDSSSSGCKDSIDCNGSDDNETFKDSNEFGKRKTSGTLIGCDKDHSSSVSNSKNNKSTFMNRHAVDDTDKRNIVFCVECKAKFKCTKLLREHCMNTHPVKSTVGRDCDYCNEKFEDFGSLIKHMKLHVKPFECDGCWEGFYSQSDLKSHKCRLNRKKKNVNKTLQQCEQCGKSYPSGYIKLHIRTHGNDTPYSCKYCPKKFKVRCSLNSHVLWKHKKTKNHSCHICNATFVSASSRSSHVRKEHFNERKHICVTCGKGFFQRSDMKRHFLTHTGVKNFHCEMCDKSYQTRYGLNVHLKSHSHVQYTHATEKSQ